MFLACKQFIGHTTLIVVYYHLCRTVIQVQFQRSYATVQTVCFIVGIYHWVKVDTKLLSKGFPVHFDLFHSVRETVIHHLGSFLIDSSRRLQLLDTAFGLFNAVGHRTLAVGIAPLGVAQPFQLVLCGK